MIKGKIKRLNFKKGELSTLYYTQSNDVVLYHLQNLRDPSTGARIYYVY